MSLNITARACQLGASINTRTEKHGAEDVPACDIPLAGLMLDADELRALAEDPYIDVALFTEKAGHWEPNLAQFHPLYLNRKLAQATVTITLSTTGKGKVLKLENCKLKDLALTPQSGGSTSLALKVQMAGDDMPKTVGLLCEHLLGHITVEITDAITEQKRAGGQQELPIHNAGGGGNAAEPEAEAA